jgi:hypothetical protein
MPDAQAWEGKQFPHTLSVLELNRMGFRYWGWYGLNEGGGFGLARSNDLVHWQKYEQNPLLTNARWPSVLEVGDTLYLAFTRDYDTPTSYIALGTSRDGIHVDFRKVLVQPVANQRNQNPNLFRDPRSSRYYLTWYRGNDHDHFEIVSRNAATIEDLDTAPEKILLTSSDTLAAPNLLYVPVRKPPPKPVLPPKGPPRRPIRSATPNTYFLATEIYPFRGTTNPLSEWEIRVYAADTPDGDFHPLELNPVLRGQRACLFQYIFKNRFYGYDCHLETPPDHWMLEEVEAPLE